MTEKVKKNTQKTSRFAVIIIVITDAVVLTVIAAISTILAVKQISFLLVKLSITKRTYVSYEPNFLLLDVYI